MKGDDLLTLQQASQLVQEKMKEFPELSDIKDSLSESKKEIEISVDQNKARIYGLSSAQVLETVRSWITEDKLGDLRFDNILFKAKVTVDPSFKKTR